MTTDQLYPFLAPAPKDPAVLLGDLARSTAAKAREITALRRLVAERDGVRLADCARDLAARFAAGGRLFSFGNGGSSTDAAEVARTFVDPPYGRPLPAVALTAEIAVVTALTNDVGFEVVFARQLAALARPGDVAFGLSTSGGSANVVRGFTEARRLGLLTVGLAGYSGGAMGECGAVDHLFAVPSDSVHRIQEAQTTVYHVLWELIQEELCASACPDK